MAVQTRSDVGLTMILALVVLALSLLPLTPAYGVVVDDLYRATVPVSGGSDEELAEGYRQGLARVLVKVSGDRSVVNQDEVATVLEDAGSLVDGRQLRTSGDDSRELRLQFSRSGVNRALADAGARVWGMNRPLTLAWVAVQDGGDRGLLAETGESSEQGWSALLIDEADARGIPLALPPADRAGDRRLLSEVWGQFMGQVSRASSGLEHDLLAVVRISRLGSGWQASWLYEGAGIEQSRSVTAETPQTLVEEMVDNWASDLAGRYGVSGGAIESGPRVRLQLDGVDSPGAYAAAKRALAQLNPVKSVGAVAVTPDHIVFEVEYEGELSQLRQNIALEQRFRAQDGQQADREAGEDNDFRNLQQTLYYRWQQQAVVPPSGDEGG
ncbi:DUF2066 domain-containing protein [Marinobacter sp.]|uniref:DUF2066 domain-containing protein n=1 Tax=Marinobacter sp. TaxID=50741 RepID=UPI00356689D0